jgi:hypothetical protein
MRLRPGRPAGTHLRDIAHLGISTPDPVGDLRSSDRIAPIGNQLQYCAAAKPLRDVFTSGCHECVKVPVILTEVQQIDRRSFRHLLDGASEVTRTTAQGFGLFVRQPAQRVSVSSGPKKEPSWDFETRCDLSGPEVVEEYTGTRVAVLQRADEAIVVKHGFSRDPSQLLSSVRAGSGDRGGEAG